MSAENPDLEIAQAATLRPITEIAETAGVPAEALVPYGSYKAKIDVRKMTPTGRTGLASCWSRRCHRPLPARASRPPPSASPMRSPCRATARWSRCASPHWARSWASRAVRPAAAMPRWCRWRTSTSISPVTSTPSRSRTTPWPPWSTTTSTRAMHWASTRGGSSGTGSWTSTTGRCAVSPSAWAAPPRACPVRTASTSSSPPRSWRCCAWPPICRTSQPGSTGSSWASPMTVRP